MQRIKIITASFFLFLFSTFCSAQDFLTFSTETEYGVLNGNLREFVVYLNDDNELAVLSRLDWDITNVWYFGNTFTYSFFDKFIFSFGYKAAINQPSGIMQDSDWQDEDKPEFRTNYSAHDNAVTSYSKIDLNISYKFSFPFHIAVSPILSWEFENYDFLATDGYFDYTNDIYDGRKGTFSGPVISYSQNYASFRAGLSLQTYNLNHFDAGLSGFVTPNFSMNGFDDHLIREPPIHWWDKMENGIMYQGNGYFNFIFNEHFKLGLNGGIQFIPFMYGETYQKYSKYWINIHSFGGGSRSVWNAGAAFTVTL